MITDERIEEIRQELARAHEIALNKYPDCPTEHQQAAMRVHSVAELLDEVRRLREAVKSTLVWFGPSFEQGEENGGDLCPICEGITEHRRDCPYALLLKWNKG